MGLWPRSRLLLLLLMLWVLAALSASACINSDPCVLSCEGCPAGEYVPDPENCRRFYFCQGSNPDDYYPVPFSCGCGYVYDPITQDCEEGDSCEECPAGCVYECPASGYAIIPSFTDCNTYYICMSGSVVSTETCDASTPFFDGLKCQADESRCCHCHAYCYANTGFVADPLDCRQYYVCLEQGAPTYVATCPDGEYFNSSTQECSEQASCVTQCTNVVGADDCIEPFTCQNTGFFAMCPNQCSPLYYHCTSATGEYQDVESCEGGTVFHPTSHGCVSQADCP